MCLGCATEQPPGASHASQAREAGAIEVASVTCRRGHARPRALSAGEAARGTFNAWLVVPGLRGFDEEHELDTFAVGPDGAWSKVGVRLEPEAASFVHSESTLFSCEEGVRDSLLDTTEFVFAVRTYDAHGALADCVMWGDKREEVLAFVRGEPGGEDVTAYSAVSDMHELRECRSG
jgi:hypothetical protein